MDFGFGAMSPAVQTLLGTLFTWGMTALGAAVVFLHRDPGQKALDVMLGFAAGATAALAAYGIKRIV